MIDKKAFYLKYKTWILLIGVSQSLTGCSFLFSQHVDKHQTLYAIQKEKTSRIKHKTYKKIKYFQFKQDFWIEIKKDFSLVHYEKHPAVKAQIQLLMRRKHQLQNTLQRSIPYIQYIQQQVKKRNLPGELIFLPFVESTYNPFALHPVSKAAGLWQLIPGTAQRFGIRQDLIFDGKYDLYTSTHAALDYLTYLNQVFCGNWLFTLAAYTTGEGNVKRALDYTIKQKLNSRFWHLPIALDATNYVAKLLAISTIINNPKKYGIVLPKPNTATYLQPVTVSAGISLTHAAMLCDISIEDLQRFNPGFKRLNLTPKHSYRLLLPAVYINTFIKNLNLASSKGLKAKVLYYKVKPNESLHHIAKKHNTTIEKLCFWNDLQPHQTLKAHKKLVIMKMMI